MSDVKFNCPLKNKPIAEGKKKEKEREGEREREKGGEEERGREGEGEERGVCNKTILRNHEATPRAGLL